MERRGKLILVIALFVGALLSGYFAAESYANYKLKEKFDRRLAKLPLSTAYRSFHYNLLKNDIEIKDFTLKEGNLYLSIGELYIDLPFTLRKKEFPKAFSVTAKGVEVPTSAPFVGELLKFTGYKRPFIKVDFASSYTFKGDGFDLFLTAAAKGLGALQTEVKLAGIDRELAQKVFEGRVPPKILEKRGALKELRLVYRDFGLFNMFIDFISSQEGEEPQKVKRELEKTIYQAMKGREEFAQRVAVPLIEFIENPKCLELTLTPKPPVKLAQLLAWSSQKPDVEETLKRLDLKLRVCD